MQQKDMNTINDLVEIGLINPKNSQEILLHPTIREIVVEELDSSVSRCSVLLDSLREISNRQGYDYVNNKILFHTVESIIGTIEIDDAAYYLLFLETVFQYMDKYQYISGMKLVITEMSQILSDDSTGTINDRVCLLDCRAALEQNAKQRIGLLEDGLRMLGEIHAGNAHLAANLHNNVGVMYHQSGQMDEARAHLEQAIRLMDNYGLNDYQDRVAQTCSYASILTDQGSAWRAYMMMQKIAREVREHNSDHCIDYALIQETMGGISVIKGDPNQADLHYRTAMAIYEVVYENEPVLLEEKRREIGRAKMSFRHGPLIDTT
jgi:tetratricopeptide (TPR) repeat protein